MIVIDTHVLLWFFQDHPQLDESLKLRMESDPAKVFVPTISIWEIGMLAERGRLKFASSNAAQSTRDFINQCGFNEANLTGEVAVLSRTLQFTHNDPADRFIAATAYAMNAELATSDEKLRTLPWLKLAY